MKTIILALASVVLISACDIVEPPFRKTTTRPTDTTSTDTLSPARGILIEKFTGQICGPCPPANDEALQISLDFPTINFISYHAGNLSKPDPSNGYEYEYRTSTGNEIGMAFFKATTADNIITPMGVIDRIGYDTVTKVRIGYKSWRNVIAQRIDIPSPVMLRIYPWYDPTSRTITVSGVVQYLEQGFKDYHIALALVEDSIVKPQKQLDGSKIADYVHKSVFRANIPNTAWGSTLSDTDQPKGSKVTFTRTLQFATDSDWNPKHLKVVGYVYRNFNVPTVSREVLQSTTKKVSIVP